MSIFKKDGRRVSPGTPEWNPDRLAEEELFQDPYAWSWPVAKAFIEAFQVKFSVQAIRLEARYEKNNLGSCRELEEFLILLRPSMRGQEAWCTLGHELAHVITPRSEPTHGNAFYRNLGTVHQFWVSFLASAEGQLKEQVIQMVLDHGARNGRPIGMNETTGPRGFPWKS